MRPGTRFLIVATVAALALGACQDGRARLGAAPSVPSGIPIAFDSIEGGPPELRNELAGELAAAASARNVELAGGASPARYRLRGYLTTETGEDGATSLAFVWDVFDADKRRAKRVAGMSPIGGSAASPWQGLDKQAMRRLAAKSMDKIAIFLAASGGASPERTGPTGADEPAPG